MLPTHRYTLSLHDALPILFPPLPCSPHGNGGATDRVSSTRFHESPGAFPSPLVAARAGWLRLGARDRKSTRLNSSHPSISYAVFCLKKKSAPGIFEDRPSA